MCHSLWRGALVLPSCPPRQPVSLRSFMPVFAGAASVMAAQAKMSVWLSDAGSRDVMRANPNGWPCHSLALRPWVPVHVRHVCALICLPWLGALPPDCLDFVILHSSPRSLVWAPLCFLALPHTSWAARQPPKTEKPDRKTSNCARPADRCGNFAPRSSRLAKLMRVAAPFVLGDLGTSFYIIAKRQLLVGRCTECTETNLSKAEGDRYIHDNPGETNKKPLL